MASSGPAGTAGSLPQAPPKPWWTSQLDDCYKKLQANNQRCIRNNSDKNKKQYMDSQRKYVQTVQSHQAAYTSNLIQMMQYCPSGQFWTLRQQQQTSFALPMSPIINNNCHHGYRPNNHRSSDGSEDAYYQQVENYPEELGS